MRTAGLFHVAIKTNDLGATVRFYRDVMGLVEVPRPDFGFPGAWLGCPLPGGQAIFHIYAGGHDLVYVLQHFAASLQWHSSAFGLTK